ncbi:MAG: hypothetical protein MJA32_13940, partial [Proteobacteria bacterium]|nr:hypothetical protein [Pseudomonadota bacterium]
RVFNGLRRSGKPPVNIQNAALIETERFLYAGVMPFTCDANTVVSSSPSAEIRRQPDETRSTARVRSDAETSSQRNRKLPFTRL